MGACHRTAGLNILILNLLVRGQKTELKRAGYEERCAPQDLRDSYTLIPASAMPIDPPRSKKALLFQTFSRSPA